MHKHLDLDGEAGPDELLNVVQLGVHRIEGEIVRHLHVAVDVQVGPVALHAQVVHVNPGGSALGLQLGDDLGHDGRIGFVHQAGHGPTEHQAPVH